jgi:O-acetyl-ADP-ribose deacetylase (regulator of RNase III)
MICAMEGSALARLRVQKGDITQLEVDAVVNAANSALLPGGGVCGAIHSAAGPGLEEECRRLGGCATGDARITSGYGLLARWVVHAFGPVWRGGDAGEDAALAGAYRRSIDLAAEAGARTMAFPALSTGIYGFPVERATRIAVAEVLAGLERHPRLDQVVLCCFSDVDLATYRRVLAEATPPRRDPGQ